MKKIIVLLVLGCWQTLFAANTGGGTVVGNGAGSVESNFQHAYFSLTKIIPSCTLSVKCLTTDEENMTLNFILTITKDNANKKDRLVFVSEKANPGFFTTGDNQAYRIAKTFLNPDSPIYINSDMLYTDDGKPAIGFQSIIRILIHELGHQTGLVDHAALDILGVKVSSFSEDRTNHYVFKIEEGSSNIQFDITNLDYPVRSSILIFNWKNTKSQDLSLTVLESNSCTYDSESYSGMDITNGHYDIDEKGLISFQAWVNVYCYERFSTQTFAYRKVLTISLDQNYEIIGMKIK